MSNMTNDEILIQNFEEIKEPETIEDILKNMKFLVEQIDRYWNDPNKWWNR